MINRWQLIRKWQIVIGCLLFLAACTSTKIAANATIASNSTNTHTPTSVAIPNTTTLHTATPKATTTMEQRPLATVVPTLPPTPLPTALPTPTWTPNPPGVLTELPPITHDLFVIADGSLKVWRQATGSIDTLLEAKPNQVSEDEQLQAEIITSFQIDSEGNSLIAAQQLNDDPPTHALIWLNLASEETVELIVATPYLLDFAVSPDGENVAYTIGDPESLGDIGNNQTRPFKGTIYLQDVYLLRPPKEVGNCTNITLAGEEKSWPGCRGLLWSPDGQQIIWDDARGIWSHSINAETTTLLQPNIYPKDNVVDLNTFMPVDWSPSGRFLRLDVGHYEGISESILDLQTGQLIKIPYTFAYEGPVISSTTWTQDNRLFMVRTEGAYGNFVNYAEFWRILPEQGELMLEQSIHIPTGPDAYLSQAAQLADGSFAFALFSFAEGDDSTGLYHLDSPQGVPQKINELPPQINYYATVYWIQNGDGALVIWYQDRQNPEYAATAYDFVYLKPNEPFVYHVRPLLGHVISSDNMGKVQVLWNDQ